VPTLPYDIRGFYFVPLKCSYSKYLNLLPRDNPMNLRNRQQQQQQQPKQQQPVQQQQVQQQPKQHQKHQKHGQQHQVQQKQQQQQPKQHKVGKLFRIMKTMKPDVYEVYSEDKGELQKQGTLLVQTTECSKVLFTAFQGKSQSDEVRVKCVKNERFDKWEPVLH